MSKGNTNAWSTTSGLAESYTAEVEDAYFDYDPEYRDGDIPQLYLELGNVTTEDEVDLDDTQTQRFGTGNGWEVVDNGGAVEHESGRNKQFHEKTRLGILINRVVEIGAVDAIAERGTPQEAGVWKGLKIKFERHTEDYGKIDGEEVKVDFMLPVEIVAEGGGSKSKAKGGNKALVAKLTKLAKNSDDHDTFLDAALEIDGVTEDDDLFEQVSDDSDAGFYAQAA